ncbi:MAG TPA: pyridoxamine 5'-phosphate oxidase family protein [Conexibacter sp.]|jgi:nitroimidazol reductase NimA-like FMN-containing flavoprotein (pyridoxamine 5'-phosphate oxidase superfamily)|nr:pyridoxamine 5'-phosphate oxidase family protein [Conexibacter sp.]
MRDPRSKTTATAENALTPAERDAFLMGETPLVTRFSTIRPDGWAHTAPTWYWWTGTHFLHALGPGRRHLRNVAENPKVTECVDIDQRADGSGGRAAAVVCFGEAEIVDDRDEIVAWSGKMLERYLGAELAAQYLQFAAAEIDHGRRLVKVTPVRWLTWDYAKVD